MKSDVLVASQKQVGGYFAESHDVVLLTLEESGLNIRALFVYIKSIFSWFIALFVCENELLNVLHW